MVRSQSRVALVSGLCLLAGCHDASDGLHCPPDDGTLSEQLAMTPRADQNLEQLALQTTEPQGNISLNDVWIRGRDATPPNWITTFRTHELCGAKGSHSAWLRRRRDSLTDRSVQR